MYPLCNRLSQNGVLSRKFVKRGPESMKFCVPDTINIVTENHRNYRAISYS